jgi:hypothetical protein
MACFVPDEVLESQNITCPVPLECRVAADPNGCPNFCRIWCPPNEVICEPEDGMTKVEQ